MHTQRRLGLHSNDQHGTERVQSITVNLSGRTGGVGHVDLSGMLPLRLSTAAAWAPASRRSPNTEHSGATPMPVILPCSWFQTAQRSSEDSHTTKGAGFCAVVT